MAQYAYVRRGPSDVSAGLDASDVFGELTDHLLDYGDLNWALDKLLREGVSDRESGMRIKGLNQVLKDIENRLRDYFRNTDIDPARQELDEMLRDMIRKAMEESARQDAQSGCPMSDSDRQGLEDRWNESARKPSQFIQAMRQNPAMREGSPEDASWLESHQEQVRNFEDFYEDYSYRFRGRNAVSLEEALKMVEEIRKMEDLERNLRKGSLERVDPNSVDQVSGDEAMTGLNALKQIRKLLIDRGYVTEDGYFLKLTPMAIRKIAQKALQEIFFGMKMSPFGRHPSQGAGMGLDMQEETKDYHFGDVFAVNVGETLKRSLLSGELRGGRIGPRDYVVHKMEKTDRFSTALLIDMSWSMAWGGKFTAAKKVALALEHLIQTQYPTDHLHLVGFFTYAVQIKSRDLPFVNLNHIEPFTNMQDALRLATKLLDKDGHANRQIVMVTDGQPTAYVREDGMHIEWPYLGLSPNAFYHTLEEVRRITKKGITLNVFMIDENPALRTFVEEMIKINKGRGLFTRPDELGRYIIVDYIRRRARRMN